MAPAHNQPKRISPPADAKRIRSDRGAIAFWQLAPTVYATHVQGYMTREMSQLIIDEGERLYTGKHIISGFHNWLAMTNYDSACRVELTAWVFGHRKQTALHIAVASRIVAMGVSVANLALGSLIETYDNEIALEHALAQTLIRVGSRV